MAACRPASLSHGISDALSLSCSSHTGLLSAPHTPHTPCCFLSQEHPSLRSLLSFFFSVSRLGSNVTSGEPALSLIERSPQDTVSLPCLIFLTARSLSGVTSLYLLDVCLILKTGSSLQVGTLPCGSPWRPCPQHVAQGTWVRAEWMASIPVSPIPCSLVSPSSCLYLSPSVFPSPHSHFSLTPSSRSYIHVSL